ncbi:MAG TPA: tripartite tricarboxylate transporter substrate-binding protein [Acetobacteraceae bacterium]
MITRRRIIGGGLALPMLIRSSRAASRRITILVGHHGGSTADSLARACLPFIARHIKFAEVAVRNLPGDAGLVALNALADAPPSGATIGWVITPTLPARMVDRSDATLLQRLTLLGAITHEPVAFVSPAASPLGSAQDIIQRVGQDADAQVLGTPPPGSPAHLMALRLQRAAQAPLNIVPFPSAEAARQAVLAGNVAAAALALSHAIADIQANSLTGVGISARSQPGSVPDMVPLDDTGIGLSASIRRGIAVPAGFPADLAALLIDSLKAVTTDDGFRAHAAGCGYLAEWLAGPTWASQVEAERADLAQLWQSDPWLPSSGG